MIEASLNLNDPNVQSALIGAISSVLASLIASICALIVTRQIADRRKLAAKLAIAQTDIAFLLAVEQLHCTARKDAGGASLKLTLRDRAREGGHKWSGIFTPGRIAYRVPDQVPTVPGQLGTSA